MALSLVLEAAEVLEHFQWKSPEEMAEHVKNHKAEVGEELADTLYWVLLMAHDFEIDIVDIFEPTGNFVLVLGSRFSYKGTILLSVFDAPLSCLGAI